MKRARFIFEVKSEVEFSEDEVDLLLLCSEHHYDLKCRQLSKLGGLVFGMKNTCLCSSPRTPTSCTRQLSTQDLNTLCKVMELSLSISDHVLCITTREKLRDLLVEALAKSRELNAVYLSEELRA